MIWVVAERADVAWELLTLARGLEEDKNPSITAFITGDQEVGELALAYGADRVNLLEMPVATSWEQYVWTLGEEAIREKPWLILVNASPRGQTLAAQLAALLDCPCLSNCHTVMTGGDDKVYVERFSLGGSCIEKITAFNRTLVITIPARAFSASKLDQPREGEIAILASPAAETVILLERVAVTRTKVELEKAPVVIGVGRGFASKENLILAERLAEQLGGVIACSRSVAEDLHWLPPDTYLGITGRTVKPKLYLAIGISGQPQHLFGIRDARVIVAINVNANAPISGVADYFIKADFLDFVPKLLREIATWKGARQEIN